MPKRDFRDFSGYVPGRTVARRGDSSRQVFNEARAVSRYAPKRWRTNRFYTGRGVRPGSYMLRRFRGLRTYPQAGIETKYFDTIKSAAALAVPAATQAWTGNEYNPTTNLCFNCPQQGTGASNREGRVITMQSLQINGMINMNPQADATAADTPPVIKYWIVLDKQTNGGTATGLDSELVFDNPTTTSIGGMAPLRNMLYSKRFKVLKSGVINVSQVSLSYDGTNMEQNGAQVDFSCFVNLKGLKTEFLGNAGTSADIVTNGLFLLMATSSASLVPSVTYNARLRFRG